MAWLTFAIATIAAVIAVGVLIKHRAGLKANSLLLWVTNGLSLIQSHPGIQVYYSSVTRSPEGVFAYGFPFFIVAYLVFGRFEKPSVPIIWAGTYLGLFLTDIGYTYFQLRLGNAEPAVLVKAIGGGGFGDALLILPIGGALLTAFINHQLCRGHRFGFMLGVGKPETVPLSQSRTSSRA